MMISLDGYFEGENHDLSWHHVDGEFGDFAVKQLDDIDTLLFGRTTYDMMASFWPTEQAIKDDRETAERMNTKAKIVFSHTLEKADWHNTTIVKDDIEGFIEQLKTASGKDIAIFGSNNLMVHLTELGLVDEYRIMVNPVIIGKGTLLFEGIKEKLSLQLLQTRKFRNGNVLLTYKPTT